VAAGEEEEGEGGDTRNAPLLTGFVEVFMAGEFTAMEIQTL